MKKENESLYKFGSRVQHLRTTLGLPQEMLAHEAGVHGHTLAQSSAAKPT